MSFVSILLEPWPIDPMDATVLLLGALSYYMLVFPLSIELKH